MLYEKRFLDPDTEQAIHDVHIFGGTHACSRGQISAIIDIIAQNFSQIRGLSLDFTRIQNHGVIQLCQSIQKSHKKAVRLFDLGLYSLNLTNNFIDYKGIEILCSELFKVSPKTIEQIVIQQDDPNSKFINDHHRV